MSASTSKTDKSPVGSLYLRSLEPGDHIAGFSMGREYVPLKTFLQREAQQFHACNITKTYVFVDEDSTPCVWGYASLQCSELKLDQEDLHPEDLNGDYRYKYFPAVKLVRLAVDRRVRGNGLGKSLVDWCVAVTHGDIMPTVGCRFLIVDAKQDAVEFYRNCGFTLAETPDNFNDGHPLMFYDLHKLNGDSE